MWLRIYRWIDRWPRGLWGHALPDNLEILALGNTIFGFLGIRVSKVDDTCKCRLELIFLLATCN